MPQQGSVRRVRSGPDNMSAASVQEAPGESRNDADSRFEPEHRGTERSGASPRSGVSSQWLKAGVRQPVGLTASTRRSRRASRRRAGEHGAPAGRSTCAPVAPKARTQALPHGDARACVLAKHPARHWDATRSATSLPSFTSSTENTGESRKRSVSKIKPSQVVFSQALYSSG